MILHSHFNHQMMLDKWIDAWVSDYRLNHLYESPVVIIIGVTRTVTIIPIIYIVKIATHCFPMCDHWSYVLVGSSVRII
jgi:hypothetical protein